MCRDWLGSPLAWALLRLFLSAQSASLHVSTEAKSLASTGMTVMGR